MQLNNNNTVKLKLVKILPGVQAGVINITLFQYLSKKIAFGIMTTLFPGDLIANFIFL